jgi:hypothetical protein
MTTHQGEKTIHKEFPTQEQGIPNSGTGRFLEFFLSASFSERSEVKKKRTTDCKTQTSDALREGQHPNLLAEVSFSLHQHVL